MDMILAVEVELVVSELVQASLFLLKLMEL